MVKLDRVSLNKNGLKKFFSPNEARILELLWDRQCMGSRDIQRECDDLSLACVSGTLDRLVKSGFVRREIDETKNRVSYVYYPMEDREGVGTKISERIIESLIDTFGDATIDTIGRMRKRRLKK